MVIEIDTKQHLIDWALNYLKNKDIITNSIENISMNSEGFDAVITHKTKTQYLQCSPMIQSFDMQKYTDKFVLIVALNNKENLKKLMDSWKELIKFPKLSIMFVNPLSQLEKRWIIYPYTHHKISDDASLKLGLSTMAESVEEISEEELKSKI